MKKISSLIFLTFVACTAFAQQTTKIGYVDLEYVLSVIPDTRAMNEKLITYQKMLETDLKTKNDQAQQKYTEAIDYKYSEEPKEEILKSKMDIAQRANAEVEQLKQTSEQAMLAKRQELLQPIIKKVETAIDEEYKAGGYAYILNSIDGSGNSIIIKGPEQNNLTETLLKKLGVDVAALKAEVQKAAIKPQIQPSGGK